jgi:hypothetical protein
MKIKQLSLFLENKPGHLSAICRALAEADINIVTLSLADTQQFGILRLIVEEWARAQSVLEAKGFVAKVSEVVATEVEDRPGGMAEILEILDAAKLNIEYVYAFTFRRGNKAVLVFRFEDADKAVALLTAKGLGILNAEALFRNDA